LIKKCTDVETSSEVIKSSLKWLSINLRKDVCLAVLQRRTFTAELSNRPEWVGLLWRFLIPPFFPHKTLILV
jgi:hypothetical protein